MTRGIKHDLELPSHWTKAQGLDIHYKCLGEGPPVVLIHGGANDWHEWERNIAFLAQDFRICAPDFPGFGLSQSPNVAVSPYWSISLLKNLMDALSITTAHLIGHSLGGVLSLAFALDFPERVDKLVLVDSGGFGEISQSGQLRLSLLSTIKRLFGKGSNVKYENGPSTWLFINRLHEVKPPVMIIWGEKDPYVPVSQAKLAHSLIPNSQLYIFSRCHHAPQKECAEEFNNLICHFLTG